MINRVRDKPFGTDDGNRTLRRDDARKLEGFPDDLHPRPAHDARNEPKRAHRLVRAKRAPGQRELVQQRRVGRSTQLGQAREGAHVGRETDVDLFDAEGGVRGREAHVDGAEHVEP